MKERTRQYWVDTLALFDPKDVGPTRPRSKAYTGMVKAGIPFYDRVAINREAAKLYRERRRPAEKTARLAMGYGAGVSRFMDGYDDPRGPTGRYGRNLPKYGGRLTEETAQRAVGKVPELAMGYCGDTVQYAEGRTYGERRRHGNAFIKFNTEGEKQMEKIDWHKPLRAISSRGAPEPEKKVYTYKSGKQRVVWIDERVYPVDEQGRAVADVWYDLDRRLMRGAFKGARIVENVPAEEKFFLGLWRNPDGTYWLTDGGMVSDTGTMNYWKRLMTDQPHWIVDTRKSAEPPKAIEHDPKDYVTIYTRRDDTFTSHLMTKREAEAYVSEPGEQIVRVRTTPAPADTIRYVQLFRQKGSNEPWKINSAETQEGSWKEIQGWKAGCGIMEFVDIKVSD